MKNILKLFCILVLCTNLFGQNGTAPSSPGTSAPSAPASTPAIVAASDYKISAGDMMQFGVLGEIETNTVIRVSKEGKVVLPFIDKVDVAGLSVDEARAKITSLYKPDYYIDPQINLIVTNMNIKIVNFIGTGIARPGPVEMPSDRDLYLLEAIGKAGGLTRVGSTTLQIKRVGPDGKPTVITVKDVTRISVRDHKLEPDDVIWVGEFGLFGN